LERISILKVDEIEIAKSECSLDKWRKDKFLIYDVEAAERVEAELDNFINKRGRNKAEANQEEEACKASTRLANAKRRRENRKLWIDHHGVLNVLHTGLALEHANKRARLLAEGGYEPGDGPEAA
jgi:hypothetical protein